VLLLVELLVIAMKVALICFKKKKKPKIKKKTKNKMVCLSVLGKSTDYIISCVGEGDKEK
jgi:hypothetical protein